jgi:uncharacterized protein YaiI (UPF0178 family)
VDADACPVKKEILEVAVPLGIGVIFFATHKHFTTENEHYVWIDADPQAVDIAILNHLTENDIVLTNDYGLAAAVVPKATAISFSGMMYQESQINQLLDLRHMYAKERRNGRRTHKTRLRGPKPMTFQDRKQFHERFMKILSNDKGIQQTI